MMTTAAPPSLLVELLAQELPPKALAQLGEALGQQLFEHLQTQGLLSPNSAMTPYAAPRRLGAHISGVLSQAPHKTVQQKLMPAAVGLDAQGQPTPALLKKLAALGVDVSQPAAVPALLRVQGQDQAATLFFESATQGITLAAGLQMALDKALSKLPIPKLMSYQLMTGCEQPGWSTVQFARPAQGLVALHGTAIVPVQALGLVAGRTTRGHRFEAKADPVSIAHADQYLPALQSQGAVEPRFAQRHAQIAAQLQRSAQALGTGYHVQIDPALLNEVTALVELYAAAPAHGGLPHVFACSFDPQFLSLPPECLVLTMQANQKYFPVTDPQGQLSHRFLVVSNISPADPSAVIAGNERVVRARLDDARFFFEQDCKKTLASRLPGLSKVIYHHKLGTQAQRTERVSTIAQAIAQCLLGLGHIQTDAAAFEHAVTQAARLAKADLLSDMVSEFPELQGTMGYYYALHDGLGTDIAQAIKDHYKPRFAGDELPLHPVGLVVALADKLETLVGMFGIGQLPTGDKDPFALRRHALGIVRMLIEKNLPLPLDQLLALSAAAFGSQIKHSPQALTDFIYRRLRDYFAESGTRAHELDAVLALHPQRLNDIAPRLSSVRSFAALPEGPALAAANKRIANILKKADLPIQAEVDPTLLEHPAEQALHAHMQAVLPQSEQLLADGAYQASLQTLAALRSPIDAFFDHVLVNAPNPALKANRLALLARLHRAMNCVADLARLAS